MQSRRVVGGEFELRRLCLGDRSQLVQLTRGYRGTWTASGRSAFGLVLRRLKSEGMTHVHLPAFLCASLLQPVRALGLKYSFYPVDEALCAHPAPPSGAAVLLIHYFGWLNPAIAEWRAEAENGDFWIVEDASQALLTDWRTTAKSRQFVLLSPRKFGPIPLGGWCSIFEALEEPDPVVEALVWRSLFARLARGVYLSEAEAPVNPASESLMLNAFQAVESYLDDHPLCASMPEEVLDIIAGVDWTATAIARRQNWLHLQRLLSPELDSLTTQLPDEVTPLGFVVRLPERDKVRRALAQQRIFCPVHWTLPDEVDRRSFPGPLRMSTTHLTLPVDQRYGSDDMRRISELVKAQL